MTQHTNLTFGRVADEALEARQLLSVDAPEWPLLAAGDELEVLEAGAAVARPAAALAAATAVAAAAGASQVDAAAAREALVGFVDLWNGGQLGKAGTAGMGAYAANWNGLFRTNLNRVFDRFVNTYTDDMTVISQSRAIYLNVEAYRNAPAADQARFRNAVQRGADYLLGKAVDPNTYGGKPGGMWWGLQPDGVSPPTHTTPIGGTAPRYKHAYGQVQAMFALAHAYTVTGDADHLNAALAQLDVWNAQFADAANGAGAYLQTANENYTQRVGNRNLDYMTHAFEGLMTLDQVLPASHPRKAAVHQQAADIGNFITTRMYRDAPGSTATGYLPWYYDAQWNPSTVAGERYSTPGHNFEVAFLLSRGVELGYNPAWLDVANKLVAYTLKYGFDGAPTSPTYGAVPHQKLAFDGSRFNDAPDNLEWWQQSEAARALLHFAAVRGRADLWDEYDAASAFVHDHFVDAQYGGWYQYLDPVTLAPKTTDKGTVWTGGYHEAMLDAERVRVGTPSTSVTFAASADAYVRDGASAGANYGGAGDLQVKKDAVGWNRESYLTFPLNGLTSVTTAKLRLFGKLQSTIGTPVPVEVYGAGVTGWSEAGLNWNNKPATGTPALATQSLPDSAGRWYEWDVTSYVRDQVSQGKTAVTFCLRTATPGTAAIFNSDEAAGNRPQLDVATPAEVPQALVPSTNTLSVPEGSTAGFTVALAARPDFVVVVTVAHGSGDADVRVSAGGTLVFTPETWNVPQPVTLAAAHDADTSHGTATIEVSAPGLETKFITVTEADDDVPVTPVSLRAVADAYVRDGGYAGQNFGNAAQLQLKKAGTGWNRESYLRFDLTGVSNVGAAKLRLYGRLDNTTAPSVAFGVYASPSTMWTEPTLTWNNRPAAGATMFASATVVGTAGAWYELDLAELIRQQKAAGATAVTLVLKATAASNATILFDSDEGTNRPELIVSPVAVEPNVIVVSTQTLAVPEGGDAWLDVRLAHAPAGDVVVTVTKQAGGDPDVSAAKTTLTFTPATWSVAQSVRVSAAEDADAVSGLARYVLSVPGGEDVTVVATEVENDAPVTNVSLRATADAYVRGGTYAGINFGSSAELVVKHSLSTSNVRESYASFDLSGVSDVSKATLRLFGRLTSSVNPSLTTWVHPASGAAWSESGINWNNRPTPDATPLGTITVAGTTGNWYELDVTDFVRAEKAAGRSRATFALRNHEPSDAQTVFVSDEASANRPALLAASSVADVDTRLMAAVARADDRLRQTLADLGSDPAKYVYVTEPDGRWRVTDASAWPSAMLPGSLWSMAKMTGDAFWVTEAVRRTLPLQAQKAQPDDLAFRLAYAYWPLYASTGNVMYRQVLIDAAASKVAQFNPVVGAFRSPGRASTSGDPHANFGVLMDQITDVELVLWAANETGNSGWTDMAVRHLQTLASRVVRPDGSTYQWAYFDAANGQFVGGEGYQGYDANSTWSRGQAWAIYGFTAAYELTRRSEFLDAAKRVADWYLDHLPAGDMVPYWDFDAPGIPSAFKDSSAAAVAAAGLARLGSIATDPADASKYRKAAGDTLSQLASPAYLSAGAADRGVLLHSAWFVPPPVEVGDCSAIWGDYFFLEAIYRYMAPK